MHVRRRRPPGSVGRAARVGTDGCAACGAGRSVGCSDPQNCFAALRAAGRSVGRAESERTNFKITYHSLRRLGREKVSSLRSAT